MRVVARPRGGILRRMPPRDATKPPSGAARPRPTFTLRGERITSLEAFYDEVQAVICGGWAGFGRNLDALVDVLRGGLGGHTYGEPITVIWSDFHRSAAFARKKDVLAALEGADNVEFIRRS